MLPITWQSGILYAVSFGGYVAFSVYLPAYLKTGHGLEASDASARMAGFVVVAVIMRTVGGILCDRFAALHVLAVGFALVTTCAAVAAPHPPPDIRDTTAVLLIADAPR